MLWSYVEERVCSTFIIHTRLHAPRPTTRQSLAHSPTISNNTDGSDQSEWSRTGAQRDIYLGSCGTAEDS